MVRNVCLKILKFSLLLSLANAEVSEGVGLPGTLPGSPLLIKTLAEYVCADISIYVFNDQASADACPDNFNNVDSVSSLRSEVKVRCRWSAATLTLEVPPCDRWQVVVLVPDKEEVAAVSYSIIQPKMKYSDINVDSPHQNYTIYSSKVQDGRASFWHRHETVLAWDEYKSYLPEHKDYNVQVQFVNYTRSEADQTVTGIMTWNHTGEADACFTITNYCKGLVDFNVGPEQNHSAVVPALPLGCWCSVQVDGLHGHTQLRYRTPAGELREDEAAGVEDVSNNATLEVPEIVYIEAVEEGRGWAVRVAWAEPSLEPDGYTLVLRADAEHTLNVTGNASEATVRGVRGAGLYNVSLYAFRAGARAHSFRRAWFMGASGWRWAGAAAAGSAWASVLAALALGLCWRGLRARRLADRKAKEAASKPRDEALVSLVWDQWEVASERLVLHEVIGEGAFGKVRRGVLAPKGIDVAVKMLKDFPSAEEVRAFRLEMEVMKSVGAHGHVVSLLGCCSGPRPMLVQEYCARGDLLRFLRRSWDLMVSKHNGTYYINMEADYRNQLLKCKPRRDLPGLAVNRGYDLQGPEGGEADLTPADLLSFCRQVALGMAFLAANRLVHRDLAARNVLVTSDRTLKIADFGLSRDVYEENQYKQTSNAKMPVKWMAPESLTRRIYTSQSDVWSFGVVMWEVMTLGSSPYAEVHAARLPRLLRAGYRMPRPANCTKQLYEVMLSCWSASPRARPSFPALYRRLDELLQRAAAGDYLALHLEDPPPAPTPTPRRLALAYVKMMIGKRAWSREAYERPLVRPHSNHNVYTTPAPRP